MYAAVPGDAVSQAGTYATRSALPGGIILRAVCLAFRDESTARIDPPPPSGVGEVKRRWVIGRTNERTDVGLLGAHYGVHL